ncbi:DUF6434 domain-containing protein [Domibacillus robiginosus]|uniref:DUF6434 domain-containing protein n=1 Tax=Domibacillus robiginosus TaxID=1071054 RepID=UPI00067C85E3|nr:DUF6434 domain-containing protein [Domibacillus robiginosus]
MRPALTTQLAAKDFCSYYWLKEELQIFCRENGMSASGSKQEISSRIVVFLETGKIQKPLRKPKRGSVKAIQGELSLKTVIVEHHRCSQAVRAFFESVIPHFHFSTYIQNYFKENAGKTYNDVVDAWYEEQQRLKDPSYKKEIAPQFEYNQFMRDFFADPNNQGKSREEAIHTWNVIKKLPGSNKYNPESTAT